MMHEPGSIEVAGQGAKPPGGREGFALVVAILAIVVIGGIVAGGQNAAVNETLVAESDQYSGLALLVAERGMADALASVQRSEFEQIAVGAEDTVLASTSGQTSYTVTVRALSEYLYLFVSKGTVSRGSRVSASRTIAALARTRNLSGDFDQAMLVFGGAELKGSVRVSGVDLTQTGWTGCDLPENKPGIVARDTSEVTTQGSALILGTPAKVQDTTISMKTFTQFGSLTYADLTKLASKVYNGDTQITGAQPATTAAGACNTAVSTNWGDPLNTSGACHYYFPMIHVKGNLDFGGNSYGQGILLIDGNFDLSGTAAFYGIVIVMGDTEVGSGTARVYGTVLTANEGELDNTSVLSGNPTIQYSSCSVSRAQKYNDAFSLAALVTGRSWADLTAVNGGF